MKNTFEKIRVRSSCIRKPLTKEQLLQTNVPNDQSATLRIKHLDAPCSFTENFPLYDLVIADYDDKDFRVIRYTNRDNQSVFFQGKKVGLISQKAVQLLYMLNI